MRYSLAKTSAILSIEPRLFIGPFIVNDKEFDCLLLLITNDLALLQSINQYQFTITAPWLIFSDVVFAHRNEAWRYDWEKFWVAISDKERNKYLALNPPKEWLEWLNSDYDLLKVGLN